MLSSRSPFESVQALVFRFIPRSGFAAFVSQSLGLALVFLAQIAVARVIGHLSYGTFAYVSAWVGVLSIVARCGLETAVLRDSGVIVAREDWARLRGLVRLAGRWTIVSGSTLAALVFAGAWLTFSRSQWELRNTFFIGALLLPVLAYSAVRQSALLGLRNVWFGLAPDYLIRPLVLGLGILAIATGAPSAVDAMSVNLTAGFIAAALGQVFLLKMLPRGDALTLDPSERSALRSSAVTMLLFNGSHQLLYQIDTLMVGLLISPAYAGKYYAAKQLALVASLGLIALQTAAAPRIAALGAGNSTDTLQLELRALARHGFWFAALYAVGMLVLGKYILQLFGSEFVDAYPILLLLTAGQLIGAAGGAAGQVAAMAGLQTFAGGLYLACAVAYIAIAVVVVPLYGTVGAATIVIAITTLWLVILNVVIHRRVGVWAALIAAPARRHT